MLLLPALALTALAQQNFDLRPLDKFAAIARDKTEVTLDSDMLKLAARFLGNGGDTASMRNLVNNLTGIYVRTYEFDKEGQYSEADLTPLRAMLKPPQWNKVVDAREGKEVSEVYFQPLPNDRLGGIAIISTEPKELTVVYISGVLDPADIEKLGGSMGVPDLPSLKDLPKLQDKADKAKKKED
jgi:hypothetical protein